MYKYTPASWASAAICAFDERAYLVKYTTQMEVCFVDRRWTHDRTAFNVKLRVPNPKAVRLAIVETTNNIYLYVGNYYTIAYRRRTNQFELIGGTVKP